MAKEQQLLEYIKSLPESQLSQVRGNPEAVLKLIDNYPEWFMVIGPEKGQVIKARMAQVNPFIMIELGGYIGYPAILFGAELARVGGKYYSFEISQEYAEIAREIIDLAGLSNTVQIIVGPTKHTLPQLQGILQKQNILRDSRPVDVVFMDHAKDLYVPDFRMLESLNLVGIGSLIAADNILVPGVPEYHEYVNLTPQQRHEYNSRMANVEGKNYIGRWNVLYDSELVRVGEDGVEFSVVREYLNT